jgi:hypothetical protein
MKLIAKAAARLRPLFDPMSWFLILAGLFAFSIRLPLPADEFVNLPMALTIFQTGGLIFAIYGMQMQASMVFWPNLKVSVLLDEVLKENNTAAGTVLLGLLVFNGLACIGFCYWLTTALGAGVVGGR